MFAEQVELPWGGTTFWRDRLVVTAYSGEVGRRLRVIVVAPGLLVDLILRAEALAFDDDGVGVVQHAIEDGGGQGAIVVEDLRPVFVGAVGGDHHRGALVALADDLEQQICAVLVDGKVTELIDNQYGGLQVTLELAFEAAGGLGCRKSVDDVDGRGEQHRVSIQAGGTAQSNRQMRLAEADVADQDDVGLGCDEGQTEQVLDLRAVDLFGPAPLEVIKGFEHGEARVPDASLDAAVLAHGSLALNQLRQIIQVRALLLGGFGGQGLVVAWDVVQVQTLQLCVQSRQVTRGHDRLPRRR